MRWTIPHRQGSLRYITETRSGCSKGSCATTWGLRCPRFRFLHSAQLNSLTSVSAHYDRKFMARNTSERTGVGVGGRAVGLTGAAPGSYNSASGGIPGVTSPIDTVTGNLGGLSGIIGSLTGASSTALRTQYPDEYFTTLGTLLGNTQRRAAGDISDLLPELQQTSAEDAVYGGMSGSGAENTKLQPYNLI